MQHNYMLHYMVFLRVSAFTFARAGERNRHQGEMSCGLTPSRGGAGGGGGGFDDGHRWRLRRGRARAGVGEALAEVGGFHAADLL